MTLLQQQRTSNWQESRVLERQHNRVPKAVHWRTELGLEHRMARVALHIIGGFVEIAHPRYVVLAVNAQHIALVIDHDWSEGQTKVERVSV